MPFPYSLSRALVCAAVGGLTPSTGLLKAAKAIAKELKSDIPIFCLVRSRQGDFLYLDDAGTSSSDEPAAKKRKIEQKSNQNATSSFAHLNIAMMCDDIKDLHRAGADGFVFGCLTADGRVDTESCRKLIDASRDNSRDGVHPQLTFHRAFDMTRDAFEAMDAIVEMGFSRVLTSGQKPSALEGAELLKRLHEKYGGKITILAGGGVSPGNVTELLEKSGVREVHGSLRKTMPSQMKFRNVECSMGAASKNDEYALAVTCDEKVRKVVEVFNAHRPK